MHICKHLQPNGIYLTQVQGIKQLEQRLIHGLHELSDNEILEEILDLPHPEVGTGFLGVLMLSEPLGFKWLLI